MTNESKLREWDIKHVWHPFTPMQLYAEDPGPIIEAADGFHLIDTNGNRYLDGIASMWCNVHGYRVPEIDNAIREQLDRVAHSTLLGQANVPSIELAKDLVDRLPDPLTKVFYSDDGATAVEVAVKLAFQYYCQRDSSSSQRDTYLCLGDAYHGDTLGSASISDVARFHEMFRPLLFQTVKLPPPASYRFPAGYSNESWIAHCFQELERAFELHADRLVAFVIEPLVQGAAGILTHEPGYLRRVRELTRKYDVLLIADEVAVGCGRTGTFLACEQEDVVPDFVCLAKGLTGGYLPLAATVTTDEIYSAFLGPPDAGRTFFHGHTYTGNQLGCAAALANVRLMDQNRILDNVRKNAEVLAEHFLRISQHPHVGDIRQRGMMCGIELVADKGTKSPYPATRRAGAAVCRAARDRGLLIRPLGDVVTIIPPLAMPESLIHELCSIVEECIDVVCGR